MIRLSLKIVIEKVCQTDQTNFIIFPEYDGFKVISIVSEKWGYEYFH
jgi:hypothetical protein